MERKHRYLLFCLLAGALVPAALLSRQFLLDNVVLPLATVAWLFLRIFVLSIGQEIYWWALIILAVLFVLRRLLRDPGPAGPDTAPGANPTLDRVTYWQNAIRANVHEVGKRSDAQKALADLVITAYSTGQQVTAGAEVRKALQARQIPVSDPIYRFLFAEEPAIPRPGLLQHPIERGRHLLRSARLALARWRRRWTGREAAEYYRAIDEAIALIETSLERKDNYGARDANNH